MVKVLHLRCSGSLLGAESVILELSSCSSNFGYQSIIGVIQDSRDPYPELATVAKQRDLTQRTFTASKRIDFSCIKEIRNFIQQESIDIIHTHGYREDLYALLAFTHKPICATNHLWKKTNASLKLYAFIDSIAMSQINKVVAVSQPIFTEMRKSPFISEKKLSMISNGIDTKKFHPDNRSSIKTNLAISDNTLLIATVSSLTIEKGHKYLLKALTQLKTQFSDFHLIIIGDGPEQKNINKQINALNLNKHVTLLGRRSDISDIHAAADIYVLPSLDEGLPMSLLEAMASGMCAIATDVGDVGQCLKNNETGLLVNAKDSNALFIALHSLCIDSTLRNNLGNNAATHIQNKFSTETMTKHYCDVYTQMS